MNQFRNFERLSLPQELHIEFIRAQAPDEDPDLSYLEQEYSDADCATEEGREAMRRADAERLAAYNLGDWHMRGLFVEARILVPIGGHSFTSFTLRSAGIWGIESDCGTDYETQVWQDEETALRAAMRIMGFAFVKLTD